MIENLQNHIKKYVHPISNFQQWPISGTRTEIWVRIPEAIIGYPPTRDTRHSPTWRRTFDSPFLSQFLP